MKALLSKIAIAVAALVVVAPIHVRGAEDDAQPALLRAEFFPEPPVPEDLAQSAPPPLFEGKAFVRGPDGTWLPIERLESRPSPEDDTRSPDPMPDVLLASGSETAIAVNKGDGRNLVAVYNQFTGIPPLRNSTDGNQTWTGRTFPNGVGTYTGQPYDPWANEGNSNNEFFATLIRRNAAAGNRNTHCIIARSVDKGVTWTKFFERSKDVFQDRAMVDVDRTEALGGGSGTAHDGKIYLCYDDYGAGAAGYVGSYLQVVSSAGAALAELAVSTAATYRGSQVQPVSGTSDGQVYLMSLAGGGAHHENRVLRFHEVTGAGTGQTWNKSSMTFPTTGQRFNNPPADTLRWGLNGHRINAQMAMDIDRSNGPRRGTLYVISDRNPNQGDPTLDQGNVYLSKSTDGATTWSSAVIPGQTAGKTQFFSMISVDRDHGWIQVAYYQNEAGSTDGGVLNASSASVYFTESRDGGTTWSVPVRANDTANALDYEDPPADHSGDAYYLIGDYQQLKCTNTPDGYRAYVLWTGYDKDNRHFLKARVLCTTIIKDQPTPVEGAFYADVTESGAVLLEWTVGSLVGVDGFDVYRATSARGPFVKLNKQPLVAVSPGRFLDAGVWPDTEFWYELRALLSDGTEDVVPGSPARVRTGGTLALRLVQPSPNPFSDSATMVFDVPNHMGPVRLDVCNVAGQHVKTLVEGIVDRGRHSVSWNGTDDSGRAASAGVYFVRLRVDGREMRQRVVLLR